MKTDFQTLLEFLERCGPEVTGHGMSAPPTEEAAKLERLAAGQCNAKEREEACNLLQLNPPWLRWVAARVRMDRPISGPDPTRLPT